MRFTHAALALALSSLCAAPPAGAESALEPLRLFADLDDDDADGKADRESSSPDRAADVLWVEAEAPSAAQIDPGILRLVSSAGGVAGAGRFGLQGVGPGQAVLNAGTRRLHVLVCSVVTTDSAGRPVDPVTSHASLARDVPQALDPSFSPAADTDSLRFELVCPEGALPRQATLTSVRRDGAEIDSTRVSVAAGPCAPGTPAALKCGRTPLLRASADSIDRSHPAVAAKSVRAEVGGTLTLRVEGRKALRLRVGGPRQTELGAMERHHGRLRVHVVRSSPGGSAPLGTSDDDARVDVLREVRALDRIWGQCGIVFGPLHSSGMRIVDPPTSHLVAVGCESGLPASGGALSLAVEGIPVDLATKPTETPLDVARRLAEAIRGAGFRAEVSPNARIAPAALRTADVLVKTIRGEPARVVARRGPLSTDPTLGLCIGEVDLADGLDHFDDANAVSGTLEERTLVKGLEDGDPGTVDVFLISSFSRTGRIGESFIDTDGSSIQDAVIVDRAGVRAGARSSALAHELGHVLLDMPGHPDDFGVDRPWLLMDADAADATLFGPRRLPVAECERALRQSGPLAPIPLLRAWPLREAGDPHVNEVRPR